MSANRGESERSGELEPWLEGLRSFAAEAKFAERFAECARSLENELAELRASVQASDYLGKLDRYTGEPYEGTLRLVASPLCRTGGVLNRIWYRDDGSGVIHCVLQPETEGGALGFTSPELDACVWHEAAHGVLDTTVHLYDHDERDVPIDLGPRLKRACRGWLHGMREHLVRSVMLRLIALDKGADAAARRLAEEEYGASAHFRGFLAALERYETSRRDFPTLSDFYPTLAAIYPKPGPRPKAESGSGYPWGPSIPRASARPR
ncbi:MAG: DUF4932 domain-containing protein [Elusimicrobiota bacterium]|nr:MAG: DUF4932 domain-containing protein [Elusimicrobiota bacterium]